MTISYSNPFDSKAVEQNILLLYFLFKFLTTSLFRQITQWFTLNEIFIIDFGSSKNKLFSVNPFKK